MKEQKFFFILTRFTADIILIPFILILAYSMKFKIGWVFQNVFFLKFGTIYEHAQVEPYLRGLFVIEVIWILTFYITGIYKQFRGIMPEVDEITKVIKAVTYSTLIVMALTFVYPIIPSSRSVILYAWIGGIILLSLSRLILNYMDVYILKKGYYMTPTLIIGANDIGQDLAERFIQNPSFGYRYIGTLDSKKPKEIHYHLKKKYI